MRRLALISAFASLSCLVAAPANATPVEIRAVASVYTTTVHGSYGYMGPPPGQDWTVWEVTRKTVAGRPVTDSLTAPFPHTGSYASADVFRVSASDVDWWLIPGEGYASAESELWFSPLADVVAPITLSLGQWDLWGHYLGRGAYAGLFDVTDNKQLWAYGDGPFGTGDAVPWNIDVDCCGGTWSYGAMLIQPTALTSDHVYKLSLATHARAEAEGASVNVSGLEIVPDPGSSLLLLGIALGGLVVWRKRWQ